MRRTIQLGASLGLAIAVGLGAGACGGSTAVVGLGNGGNKIVEDGGIAEQVAEVLAEHPSTPEITDEDLARVFGAILGHAQAGDPEAALIVFRVAEAQRQDEQG